MHNVFFSNLIKVESPVFYYTDKVLIDWCMSQNYVYSYTNITSDIVKFNRPSQNSLVITNDISEWKLCKNDRIKILDKKNFDIENFFGSDMICVISRLSSFYMSHMRSLINLIGDNNHGKKIGRLVICYDSLKQSDKYCNTELEKCSNVICYVNCGDIKFQSVRFLPDSKKYHKVFLNSRKDRVIEDFEMLNSKLGNYDLLLEVLRGNFNKTGEILSGMSYITNCCGNLISNVNWDECLLCDQLTRTEKGLSKTPIRIKRKSGFLRSIFDGTAECNSIFSLFGFRGELDIKPTIKKFLVLCPKNYVSTIGDLCKNMKLSYILGSPCKDKSADVKIVNRIDRIDIIDISGFNVLVLIKRDKKIIRSILLKAYSLHRRENLRIFII